MRTTPLCALAALLSPVLCAQTPPCLAMNDQSTNVPNIITAYAFSGPTSWGWQITPTTPLIARAAQIYTANTVSKVDMVLEIWSHDPATSLPLARLAGGAWKISTASPLMWQGTNLDAPITLVPPNSYWLVWTEPGGCRVPYETGGTTLPAARRPSGGAWATTAATELKFRIFCNLLDAKNVKPKGPSCSTPAGLGSLYTNQAPTVGNAEFLLDGSGFPSGASAALLLGVQPAFPSVPLPGGNPLCLLHTDIVIIVSGLTGTGNVRQTAGSSGHVFFPLAVPAIPGLAGGYLGAQLAVLDSTSAYSIPFATTNGLQITIY